jgi:hypothetical protein
MKTVNVVKMAHGYYVTRRWYDMNKGSEFFPTNKKPAEQKKIDKAREKYIKDWTGE